MGLANLRLSKHELRTFFRKPGHKHFRECKDQVLRNFIKGVQLKYREDAEPEEAQPERLLPKVSAPKTNFKWNPLPRGESASDENE